MAGGTVKPTSKKPNKINESDRSWLESFGIKRSLTDYEQEAKDAPRKETAEAPEKSSDGSSMSKEELNVTMEGLKKLYNSLESKPKEKLTETEKEFIKILDAYKATGTGTGFLNGLQKAATDTSKPTTKEEPQVDNSTKTEEPKTTNSENTADIKTDNAGTEETVTPEAGEAKVEGEPKANTEQAQTTQEPKSEAKQTSTESSEMTPEEAYEYLSDKKNFKEANTYFSSGKDSYIGTNGKHLPKSWFDVYRGNKDSDHSMFRSPNNKDVFTASLRDKGLLEDPKKEPSREDTVSTLAEADAKSKFDDWIASKGNKFRGIFGKHKVLYSALLAAGISPAILKGIDAIGDWYVNKAIEENHIPDEEFFNGNSDSENLNNNEPGKVAEDIANAGQETAQAANTAEEQAAQALQENLPQGVTDATNQSKGESPTVANASTPANTKASTAKPAPTQDITQGLPPVVVNNTPPANAGSSGMTYSQRVEAGGQAPQAGSMAYNANNPDMVTAGLIDAMNQNSQAGSDAIGYGDLYDQNFIDFWAKRNPNLAYAVSQGRKS